MVPDREADTVFISELLRPRHADLVVGLSVALGDRLRVIHGAADIWCRDYMPVQLDCNRFIQFRYDPDYLRQDPSLRTEDGAALLGLRDCGRADLVVDGGNVVRWADTAILTDKVYTENPRHERPALRRELRRLLEVDRLVIIPKEPGDVVGHSDGVVRFVDGGTLLVNDYRSVDPAFGRRLAEALVGFEVVPFPYRPSDQPGPDPNVPPATGVYANFLQVGGMVLCPTFGQPADDEALAVLGRCFPTAALIPVPCSELAMEGGLLNCVTWNVRAADPEGGGG
jgi:agmatine deiminase